MPPLILAADDDEAWRELLSRWIKDKGCEAMIATRGADVLPLLETRRPDLIILDYDLGDRKGSDVCRDIKCHPSYKTIPVIILTSMAGKMLQIAAEHKPDHFVVKSDQPLELYFVIETLLPEGGSKGPPTGPP